LLGIRRHLCFLNRLTFTKERQHSLNRRERKAEARGFERALETARVRRSALERAWESGSGHVGDRSAWEAFNGAVEVLDHDEQSFRTNGSRLTALLDGTLGRRKEAVREAVLALVRS
jgi:hypothetical protein